MERKASYLTLMLKGLPYKEYLLTPHWKERRNAALSQAGHKCQLCAAPTDLQVHHNSYERLWSELLSDLVVLCDECHERHHHVMVKMHEAHTGMVCPHCAAELVARVQLFGEVVT